ncbi:MAG: oligosaccharide flippase family protein [Parvibaculales bacterium]
MSLNLTKIITLGLRGCGLFVGFAISIFLARFLTIDDFGRYSFLYSILMLLAIPFISGIPMFIVRELGKASSTFEIQQVIKLASKAKKSSFLYTTTIVFCLLTYSYLSGVTPVALDKYIAIFCVPLIASIAIDAGLMRGKGHTIKGQLVEYFIRPFVFILLIINLKYFHEVNILSVLISLMISFTISSIISKIIIFFQNYNFQISKTQKFSMSKESLYSIIFMTVIGGLNILFANIDIIILGLYNLPNEVGLYKIAFQLSMLVVFAQTVIHQVIQRQISQDFKLGKIEDLQKTLVNASRYISLISLSIAIIIILFHNEILIYGFGEGYRSANTVLIILIISQLLNIVCGCNGLFLNNIGYEKVTCFVLILSVLLNAGLTILLVPAYGALGAAFGSLLATFTWNAILLTIVIFHFNIHSSWLVYNLAKIAPLISKDPEIK